MTEMVFIGLKRRRKDLIPVILVTLIVTFFVSGLLMTRSMMESYLLERNRSVYGDWIIASTSEDLSHPYLGEKGSLSFIRRSCIDEGGKPTGRTLGSLSEELCAFGRISFYEGRCPEKKDEIAADLLSLQKLGYSYELGQTVTVRWMGMSLTGEQEIVEKEYTLVGTVKPFAQLWKSGADILYPNLLVTKEALSAYPEEAETVWFYHMDISAAGADPEEFYEGFSSVHNDIPIIYNSFLYDVALFGDSGNGLVTVLVITFAVFVISFGLNAYADRRRQACYRLRTLGCTRRKLNGIIATECGIAAGIPALAGLGLAYLFGGITCIIIAGAVGLHSFFAFEPGVFWGQVSALFGTILTAVLLTMFRMRDKRLRPGTTALTPKDMQKIRTSAKRTEKYEEDLFRRRRIVERKARRAAILFTIAAVLFLLLCGTRIHEAVSEYRSLKSQPDYLLSIKAPNMLAIPSGDYVAEDGERIAANGEAYQKAAVWNPYFGPDAQELEYLRTLPGIRKMQGSVEDTWHFVIWEGIEKRPDMHVDTLIIDGKRFVRERKMTNAAVNILKDDSLLLRVGKENNRTFTKEELAAVMRGEYAVILYIDGYYNAETGKSEQIPEELLTPREGQEIRIFSENDEEGIRIPVLQLIQSADVLPLMIPAYQSDAGAILFVSEITAEQLRQRESPLPEFRENYFRFFFDAGASYDATDKALASYKALYPNSEYQNYAEQKRSTMRLSVLRPLLVYGSIFLMTLLVYLILMSSMTEFRMRGNFESCLRLRLLGMTKRKLDRKLVRAEAQEALPVLFGFAAGCVFLCLWQFLQTLNRLKDPMSIWFSRITGNPTRDLLQIMEEWFLFDAGIPVMIVFALLLYIGMTFYGWQISRKALKKEGIL